MNNLQDVLGLDNINADIKANIIVDNESLVKLFVLGLGLIIVNLALNKFVK